jgi:endonuclease/exonuclease/phosphatase (EEP) superfamily protein YafD
MLINVNTRTGDAARVRQVIQAHDPDIIVLEEINARWMRELSGLAATYPHSRVQPREDNFGIGLFSKLPLTESEIAYIGDTDVPTILATLTAGQHPLHIVATHPLPPASAAYTQWRNDQLAQLASHVDAAQPTLLLGDLNITPWNRHFRKLVKQSGLSDSARGYGVQPTWPSFSPLLRIPLDHCLHSPAITIIDRQIGEGVDSDHYPLIIDFSVAIGM